jgi:hypothetical protein
MSQEQRRVYGVLKLNFALQAFDAVATYQGMRIGFQEANPILVLAFQHLGVGATLLLFKLKACVLLIWLFQRAEHYLVPPALALIATVYSLLSLGPWLAKFALFLGQAW